MRIGSLRHLPVTLFASVMGLGGGALMWRRAAKVWGLPQWPFLTFLALAVVAFVIVGVAYAAKWVRFPADARAELRHPIRMVFVPTITISVLILATALSELAPSVARVLWWIGAVGHLAATVIVLSAWWRRADILVGHMTPAWFIPIVGNVITPLAAPTIGSVELAWFAFGVGLVFWVGLLPLLLARLLTHDQPIPPKLLPTIAIFIAPPAVIQLSWQSLTGAVTDPFGRVMYAAAVMFVLLLLAQADRLRVLPFALPFLGFTFPLAAGATAAVAMAGAHPAVGYDIVAIAILALATVVILAVVALTVRATLRGQVLVPEG